MTFKNIVVCDGHNLNKSHNLHIHSMQFEHFMYLKSTQRFQQFPEINMVVLHFARQKDYAPLLAHILSTIASAIPLTHSLHNNGDDLGHGYFNLHIDMSDTKMKNIDVKFLKHMIKLMRQTFPDTLNRCEIHHAPSFFPYLFTMIKLFIPRNIRNRIFVIKDD